MASLNQLISDIELRLSKGNISDDFTIDRRQIQFWIDSERSRLMDEKDKASGNTELADYAVYY